MLGQDLYSEKFSDFIGSAKTRLAKLANRESVFVKKMRNKTNKQCQLAQLLS